VGGAGGSARRRTTLERIARRRLARQHLLRPLRDPAAVVSALGAVQAQDYAGAKWALGVRAAGATDASVERACDAGAILRTHVLRPTWHFVAPADIRWMLRLTGPRVSRAMAYYNRLLELTPAVFRRSHAAIERALRGGRHLTRPELAAVLRRARIGAVHTQRLAHLVMQAELDGIVCSGPRRGKQLTYALLEERVPRAAPLAREEALAELSRRYFATRGPATAADFAWWSGLTVRDARHAVGLLGRAAERETMDGAVYYAVEIGEAAPLRSPAAFLLPNYDELFIGLKDRRAFGDRLARARRPVPPGAVFVHVLVIDGQVVGDWRRADEGRRRRIRWRVRAEITRAEERALEAAARRYSAFLGAPLAVDRV
jgi:hypothetical protein